MRVYRDRQNRECIQGTQEDFDFASFLMRQRLYSLLGKVQGEEMFRQLPAYTSLKSVYRELTQHPEN